MLEAEGTARPLRIEVAGASKGEQSHTLTPSLLTLGESATEEAERWQRERAWGFGRLPITAATSAGANKSSLSLQAEYP